MWMAVMDGCCQVKPKRCILFMRPALPLQLPFHYAHTDKRAMAGWTFVCRVFLCMLADTPGKASKDQNSTAPKSQMAYVVVLQVNATRRRYSCDAQANPPCARQLQIGVRACNGVQAGKPLACLHAQMRS